MNKTKLGLPVGLVGAIIFLLFLFNGYTVGVIAFAFVMLCEKSSSLRTSATTALLLSLVFSLLFMLLSLLPEIIGPVVSFLDIEYGSVLYKLLNMFDKFINLMSSYLGILKDIVFVVFAVLCAINKPLNLGFIKKLACPEKIEE